MLIKLVKPNDPRPSEITEPAVFENRRRFLKLTGLAAGSVVSGAGCARTESAPVADFHEMQQSPFSTPESKTSFRDIVRHNNFYEFGSEKADPARYAGNLRTRPWTVMIDGEVLKPKILDIDDLIKTAPLEERVYRLRCVEGWSMVIPWVGFPLSQFLKRVELTGNANFVEFTALHDSKQMPAQRSALLDWPYIEGLRLDEAMHPLTILAVGLYGKVLPNQNGAPVRLVVPWKYGFKSIKSLVRIRLTEHQPETTWMTTDPGEYGFYANVNPDVAHPRWSQSKERRIGEYFKRPTLMFNGYADQVADLYVGMDLQRFF